MWGHQLYSLYGILSLVFLILIIVTSFITIALTYFQVLSLPLQQLIYLFSGIISSTFGVGVISQSVYGILSLVFLILIIVTSFITIALTYFQVLPPIKLQGYLADKKTPSPRTLQ